MSERSKRLTPIYGPDGKTVLSNVTQTGFISVQQDQPTEGILSPDGQSIILSAPQPVLHKPGTEEWHAQRRQNLVQYAQEEILRIRAGFSVRL